MADATATAGFASARHAEYFQRREALQQRLEEGDAAALAFAQAELDKTWARRAGDPARIDALEMLTRVHLSARRFVEASEWSADVVRLRRSASPRDPLLLAMALGLDATVAFGLEHMEAADAGFRESIVAYREAYPGGDPRLAQALEDYAEIVQRGLGRERTVTELLREALDIRAADPRTAPGKLAERLVQLAIGELNAGEFEQADQHLERAIGLLGATSGTSSQADDTLRAMRVQALVLQGGLAARLGQRERVDRCMATAREVRFDDEALQAEMQFTVDGAAGMQLEMLDDRRAAVELQWQLVEAMQRQQPLFDAGTLDADWQADHWLRLADLLVGNSDASDGQDPGDDLAAAELLLKMAAPRLGETSPWLFVRAEHHRRAGRDAEAIAAYQSALRLRKKAAAEMRVLFGTSRRAVDGAGPAAFGREASPKLSFGTASVLVPGGMFGTESWLTPATPDLLPVGCATAAARLLLRSKKTLGLPEFRARAAETARAGHLYGGAVLVFVHGFNVSFDDALRRGAQLVRDLNFDGTLAVFSWPSRGEFWRYGTDRKSADAAVDRLVEFLDHLATLDASGPIHAVAHSMGNRVLLPALAQVAGRRAGAVRERLGEIVLAAPAVPEAEFAAWLDVIAESGCRARFTLYASKVDKAMWVGFLREGATTLAGYTASGVPLLHAHVQSIDITGAAGADWRDLNHDVFASNPVMTEDMRQLLQLGSARAPDVRLPGLMQWRNTASRPFWAYEPQQRAAGSA